MKESMATALANLHKFSSGFGLRLIMTALFSIIPSTTVTILGYAADFYPRGNGAVAGFIVTLIIFTIIFEIRNRIVRNNRGYGEFKGSLFGLPERNFEKDFENLQKMNEKKGK